MRSRSSFNLDSIKLQWYVDYQTPGMLELAGSLPLSNGLTLRNGYFILFHDQDSHGKILGRFLLLFQ